MLGFMDDPKPVRSGDAGDLTRKVVTLCGADPAIRAVMGERQRDRRCHQSPMRQDVVPRTYWVRLWYAVSDDGYMVIETVKVSFDRGKYWSTFYDRKSGRSCAQVSANETNHFYFLDEVGLYSIQELLERREEERVIARLTRQGPEALPEEEDEKEALWDPWSSHRW